MQKDSNNNNYDLVILGGGCSSFGFLMNAYRNDKLNEIIGENGICILEKTDRFGGGTLEENLIPSNTHTIGALRYLMRQKEADMLPSHFEAYLKEGVQQNGKRPKFNNQKVYDAILPCFQEMTQTQIFQKILDRAELTSSLQMLGYFLRMSGNSFLRYAYENQMKIDYKPYQECNQITEKPKDSEFYEIQSKNTKTNEITTVKAKKLLIATGGQQSFHPMYRFIDESQKLLSHEFFKEDGFLKAIQCIEDNPDADISIIGGSHSGFSVIYMLLYGPRFYITNEFGHNNDYVRKRYEKCPICQQIGFGCKCYGDITPLELPQPILNYQCKIKKHQIKLYHRHNFRLSYINKEQALNEGYTDFDEGCIHRQEGCVNSYTGLRGLTKKLYEEIRDKKEERVKFVNFTELSEQQKDNLKKSSIVIECLGYKSILVDYKKSNNEHHQYIIDTDNFVKMDQGHRVDGFDDIYGTGLGYGIHTHDDLIGGEQLIERKVRADSIQVYLSRLSTKIINTMTGQSQQ